MASLISCTNDKYNNQPQRIKMHKKKTRYAANNCKSKALC